MGFDPRFGKTRFGLSPAAFDHAMAAAFSDKAKNLDQNAWNAIIYIDKSKDKFDSTAVQTFPPLQNYYLNYVDNGISTKELLRSATSGSARSAVFISEEMNSENRNKRNNEMRELMDGMDRIANLVRAANYINEESLTGTPQNYSTNSNQSFVTGNFTTQIQQSPFLSTHQGSFTRTAPNSANSPSTPRTPSTTSPFHATLLNSPNFQPRSAAKLVQLAQACETLQTKTIPLEMSRLQSERNQSYEDACQGFLLLLKAEQSRVDSASHRISLRQQQKQEELGRLQREQEEYERKLQKEREEEARMEREKKEQIQKQKEEDRIKEEERQSALHAAEEEAEKEDALKNAHVERAQILMSSLEKVRNEELKQFDSSKSVSRRRLQFKKVVNGKINTLSHEDKKVIEVAGVVVEAVKGAERDDAAQGGEDAVLGMGKKYLLDLLASNLIVRVQADGFNGPRGDGFPLAAMFSSVSTECEELGPVLEAHLYTVCPTAIPILSLPTSKGDENALMESLGMIKDKNGEFESFDKFLHRTEGLISIMADIMSSFPSNHTLLGGREGALTWLERFLDLVPSPPTSPLPLLTAPVLVAFLTGAGHMLANNYSSKFQTIFDTIKNDIIERLDESPVGVPSATRLKKVVGAGLDKMKSELPQGAVESLYNGKESCGSVVSSFPKMSGFGSVGASAFGSSPQVTAPSPFGRGSASPFGGGSTSNSMMGDGAGVSSSSAGSGTPFGGGSNSSNPFSSSTWGASSTFGTTTSSTPSQTPAPSPSPFSGGAQGFGTATTNNPFSGGATFQTSFGSNSASSGNTSSGFVGNTEGGNSATTKDNRPPCKFFASGNCRFGDNCRFSHEKGGENSGNTLSSSTPNPFGRSSNQSAPSPSPFGGASTLGSSPFGTTASNNNPFGGGRNARPFGASGTPGSNNPFGGAAPVPSNNPFGGGSNISTIPFSGGAGGGGFGGTTSGGGFGGETSGGGFGGGFGGTSPFGSSSSNSNPFGGPRR